MVTTYQSNRMPYTDQVRAGLSAELDDLRQRESQHREALRDLRNSPNVEHLELYAALEEQARVQKRVTEIEQFLSAEADRSADRVPGIVTTGSRVTVQDERGRTRVLAIVSPLEAGTSRDLVSRASPVGLALLGRRTGDAVHVDTPSGRRSFSILSIE